VGAGSRGDSQLPARREQGHARRRGVRAASHATGRFSHRDRRGGRGL
jgi:hypothetical protein